MLTYHNDPAVKAKYIERFARHRALDAVPRGQGYGSDGRGCFVGCTLESYEPWRFPIELGWPEWLAWLADSIFEGLPEEEAAQFGTDLLEAVPVGVNVERLWIPLAIARHKRALVLLSNNAAPYAEQCRTAIQGVITWLENGASKAAEAEAAKAAWSAAWSVEAWSAEAWSAEAAARSAEAAAAAAAWSAQAEARSAGAAARSAAWAAEARSAAWSAEARSAGAEAAWRIERDALLTALREL